MDQAIVGAVLAGGRSGRMGRDKARLELGGEPLAARAAATLAGLFADTVVVLGAAGGAVDVGHPVIRDRVAGAGPLGGLDSALHWAAGRPVFVLACDLPRVDRAVVETILAAAAGAAATAVPARAWIAVRGRRRQPLCGLYSPACGPLAAASLARGERAVHRFLDGLEALPVSLDGVEPDPLLNLNTLADRAALAASGESRR